ncbi:hypothetical protein L7F22_024250 [Adiantum nelumboides]|nr:hypothetical protein [Adiantum nelumboides]
MLRASVPQLGQANSGDSRKVSVANEAEGLQRACVVRLKSETRDLQVAACSSFLQVAPLPSRAGARLLAASRKCTSRLSSVARPLPPALYGVPSHIELRASDFYQPTRVMASSSRIGRPKKDAQQMSLSMAFFRRKRVESDSVNDVAHVSINVDLNVDAEDINATGVDPFSEALKSLEQVRGHYASHADAILDYEGSAPKKIKGVQDFKEHWKVYHPWSYALHVDDKERVFCKFCIEFKMSNPFATVGSSVIQKASLETHAKSKEHERAAFLWAEKERRTMMPFNKHLQKMDALAIDKRVARIQVLLQVVYFIAIKDKPLCDFQKDVEELLFFKAPNVTLDHCYAAYLSYSSSLLFLEACYAYLYDIIKGDIDASPFFSLMVDESTDVSNDHHMIVCLTYLSGKGHAKFLPLY